MMLISYLFNITVAWAGPVYPGVDIPISTGVSASSCSLSGTPGNGFGPVINSHSNTFECKTTNGQTVAKSSTPTAHDITQFAKGFLKGLIEGIWQQITGLWGLLFNIGPLIQLAHDLATHPQQTLATIVQVLHKQFTSLTQIRQEIVCEPYSGGQLTGVALVVVASTAADGVGGAADLGRVSKELEEISAKAANDGVLEARIVSVDEANQIGEDLASGKTVILKDLKSISNKRIGDIGEGYVIGDLKKQGFDQVVQIQNRSGNGVDVIARNSQTGEVRVIEVKTTRGNTLPGLSNKQKLGGAKYTGSRLKRAIAGKYEPTTTPAQAEEAQNWIKQASAQNKLIYKVQGVHLQQGNGGVVTAKLGRLKDW